MSRATDDPLLRHSRREAIVIGLAWVVATAYCCIYSYLFGYARDGRPLGRDDVRPILGIPSWAFWGYLVPWAVCAAFNIWFAAAFVADDDLGEEHLPSLDAGVADE